MEVNNDFVETERIEQLNMQIQVLTDLLTQLKNELQDLKRKKILQSKVIVNVPDIIRQNISFVDLEKKLQKLKEETGYVYHITEEDLGEPPNDGEYFVSKFDKETTERFSRQMMLEQIGVDGQQKLLKASVLIIGCGGIGSPCIQYLAACGVGTLGLVDYDTVELSNLHRQVIHSMASVGKSKVTSAKAYIEALNEKLKVNTYQILLDSSNAYDIIRQYDVVCDACDNAPTRYLVNDACLMAGVPLLSASALGMEGQLCVYNYQDAPCYRCVFPQPPPPEAVGSCGENGVLGPVPGLMGTLLAVEAIKLITVRAVLKKLIIYDADVGRFLAVRMRPKDPACICASPAQITLGDYELFCSAKADDKSPDISILKLEDHISVRDYRDIFLAYGVKHILIDVRKENEYRMVSLKNAISAILHADGRFETTGGFNFSKDVENNKCVLPNTCLKYRHIFFICRRGNDSQKAVLLFRNFVQRLRDFHKLNSSDCLAHRVVPHFLPHNDENFLKIPIGSYVIKNIKEGYHGWHKYIDNTIPIY